MPSLGGYHPPTNTTYSPIQPSEPQHSWVWRVLWRFHYVGMIDYIIGSLWLNQSPASLPSVEAGRWCWKFQMPNQSLVFLVTRGSYHLCTYAKSLQSCLTFCHPMDRSPPGSLSLEFSRQESWSGLPFPSPEDLPGPGIKPTSFRSPVLAGRFFTTSLT